jgi:hypothetical protein
MISVMRSAFVAAIFGAMLLHSAGLATAGEPVIASGIFAGKSGHDTTGGVSLVRNGAQIVVILKKNFSLDSAPDPKVGFGRNSEYDPSSKLGHLRSTDGFQEYVVPAAIDATKYDEVYIWCERFNVPLGVAKIR